MHFQPFGLPVQIRGVAIEMVVRRGKMCIFVIPQEIQQAMELAGKIKVIILREINEVAVFLSKQNLDLFCKGLSKSPLGKLNKDQILRAKVFSEQVDVFIWAP